MKVKSVIFFLVISLAFVPLFAFAQTATDSGGPTFPPPAPPPTSKQCQNLLRQIDKANKKVIKEQSDYATAVGRRDRQVMLSAQNIASNQRITNEKKAARSQSTEAKKDQIDNQIDYLIQQKNSCVNFLFWQCSNYHKQKDYQIQTKKNYKDQLDAKDEAYFANLDQKQAKFVQKQASKVARYDNRVIDAQYDVVEAQRLYNSAVQSYYLVGCPTF